ncbi:MAG TPA: protein arginine kinase [Planctomycetota bacterium]|nr:protein arginine kinase [Planctomycetota bacterium]
MSPRETIPDLRSLWLLGPGREQDVVISTRMRLARNLADFHFKSRFRNGEAQRLEVALKEALALAAPDLRYLPMHELQPTQRDVLFERHLVSAEHVADSAPRGVAFSEDGTTSVLVNEEDHLRLQVFAAGLELPRLGAAIDALDDRLSGCVNYAFLERYGYLTSCPTNTGTGLRVSVMLHLPALSFRRETGGRAAEQGIVKVHKAAQRLGLTVRGTHGESSRAEGDFYQISNQVTLGRPPEQAVTDLQEVLDQVVKFERNTRQILLDDDRTRLEDVVWRGWAILRHARRISSREALAHLSALRLGVWLKLIDAVTVPTLQELMVRMRPGHLQYEAGRELAPAERDALRATLIRERLGAK